MSAQRLQPDTLPLLVPSGSRVMVGGFGLVGAPLTLLRMLSETSVGGLTVIANNLGEPGFGLGLLLRRGQISHAIGSFFTSNPEGVEAIMSNKISVDLIPQGTLVEAIRAGGAGIGGFFTHTGGGTILTAAAETRRIDGKLHVFQSALTADVALIKAKRADTLGNLTYSMTGRNFNPAMATAASVVIAEVEEIVPAGDLDPDQIVTPHLYVDFLFQASTRREDLGSSSVIDAMRDPSDVEMLMARRVRRELRRGDAVNLGVGIPSLVVNLIEPEDGIFIHTENGLLGAGPPPSTDGSALDYPVDAAKHPLTALPGASYFGSVESFAMIRGGHIDVAVLGGLEVDQSGSLANWSVPPKTYGVGGAMDLAAGARRVIVMMHHVSATGAPKIVKKCSLPITSERCIDTVVTDLGVFRFQGRRLHLVDLAEGVTLEEVAATTEAVYEVSLRS